MLHGLSLVRHSLECQVEKIELIPRSVTEDPPTFMDDMIEMFCQFPGINRKNPSSLHASAKLLDNKFLQGMKHLNMAPYKGDSEVVGTKLNQQIARYAIQPQCICPL